MDTTQKNVQTESEEISDILNKFSEKMCGNDNKNNDKYFQIDEEGSNPYIRDKVRKLSEIIKDIK